MTELSTPLAEIDATIAALRTALEPLAAFPESAALLQAELAGWEARRAVLLGEPNNGPKVDLVQAGGNVYIGTEQYFYTIAAHQRSVDAYVALLRQLAATADPSAYLTPDPPPSRNPPFNRVRFLMACSLMRWEPPAPGAAPLDEATRRSMAASLLVPLVTLPLLSLPLYWERTVYPLSSASLDVLVAQTRLRYTQRRLKFDATANAQVHAELYTALADPRYAEGCRKLLHDLAETEAGRRAIAIALAQPECPRADQLVPPALHLLAAGIAGGAVSGGVVAVALAALLSRSGEASDAPANAGSADAAAQPAPKAEPAAPSGAWRIPITPAEWQAELDQRNERFGAPAGYWCCVRSGTYRIGGWDRGDPEAQLRLERFWIARVPITVAQYAAFIAAGGYRERRWWTPEGWTWARKEERSNPWRWQDAPFNSRPQQAVQGMSWYEAMAFCAWLRDQVRLPMGYTVRLPTEAEWEAAAACGPKGERRTYPWGNQPPTSRLAVFDQDWQQGAPDVGTCPTGAAACGALDMAGTIWEPALSSFKGYPQQAHGPVKDLTPDSGEVPWRGGSYSWSETYVRCGARIRSNPGDGNVYIGFRVCVAPALG